MSFMSTHTDFDDITESVLQLGITTTTITTSTTSTTSKNSSTTMTDAQRAAIAAAAAVTAAEPFDWHVSAELVSQFLGPPYLKLPVASSRALDLGCGYSDVALVLRRAGFAKVTGVDIEPACIAFLTDRHRAAAPQLAWAVADVRYMSAIFADNSLELCVDKTTLDALLCDADSDSVAAMLCEVHRVLVVGGVYLAVSIHRPELMAQLFDTPHLAFSFEQHQVGGGGDAMDEDEDEAAKHSVYLLRKTAATPPNLEAVRSHQQNVQDAWYTQSVPFLTPERTSALMASFKVSVTTV
jgi:ubiquinone/menaquinone biosynthesis C-methylase UbiE